MSHDICPDTGEPCTCDGSEPCTCGCGGCGHTAEEEAAAAAYRDARREGPSGDALDHERKIIVSFDSTFDVMECEHLCLPAGDLGVGGREVAYLFGQYKRLTNEWTGVLTGKGLSFGGSLARTEATGYGLAYFVDEYLKSRGDSFEGKNVVVHGSGNVAIYAVQKVSQLGGKVLACSDTHGWVEDPDGIDYTVLEHVYNKKRSGHDKGVTLAMYVDEKPNAVWHEGDGRGVWQLPCDIALPCARENTLLLEDAQALVANGCKVVGEGANMPTTIEATTYFQENGVAFMPGKAANAGGVLVSGLEMSQNAEHLSWTFEEVDGKLEQLMRGMFHNVDDTAKEYGEEGNFVMGANIAGFLKVADAMLAQGVC